MMKRLPCPTITCSHDMPSGSPMCTTCWIKVPSELRKRIYTKAPGSTAYKDLIREAERFVIQADADAAKVPS